MGLMRYRAWVTIPSADGGVIRSGDEFVADENDPRCKNGRAKLLGPAEAERGPSPEVQEALDAAAAVVAGVQALSAEEELVEVPVETYVVNEPARRKRPRPNLADGTVDPIA